MTAFVIARKIPITLTKIRLYLRANPLPPIIKNYF